MAEVLRLERVTVRLQGRIVLQEISFSLQSGQFMGVVGPNGAGKSTLLAAIIALVPVDEGRVHLFGERLHAGNARKLRKHIGFLAQLPLRHPHLPLRVRDFVAMGLRKAASPWPLADEDRAAVEAALAATSLSSLADCDLRTLSGGQYQRARIARAIVAKPRLLLLDEPSAALDAQARNELFRLLRRLADQGTAIVMVEHDIAAISRFVDCVACLNRRIHQHLRKGEAMQSHTWQALYGEAMQPIAHDARCLGCEAE